MEYKTSFHKNVQLFVDMDCFDRLSEYLYHVYGTFEGNVELMTEMAISLRQIMAEMKRNFPYNFRIYELASYYACGAELWCEGTMGEEKNYYHDKMEEFKNDWIYSDAE